MGIVQILLYGLDGSIEGGITVSDGSFKGGLIVGISLLQSGLGGGQSLVEGGDLVIQSLVTVSDGGGQVDHSLVQVCLYFFNVFFEFDRIRNFIFVIPNSRQSSISGGHDKGI